MKFASSGEPPSTQELCTFTTGARTPDPRLVNRFGTQNRRFRDLDVVAVARRIGNLRREGEPAHAADTGGVVEIVAAHNRVAVVDLVVEPLTDAVIGLGNGERDVPGDGIEAGIQRQGIHQRLFRIIPVVEVRHEGSLLAERAANIE